MGQDIDAMLGLADAWCDRRIERGQLFYFEGERTNLDRLKSICLTQTAHPHASLKWKNDLSNGTYFTSDLSTYQGWMEQYRKSIVTVLVQYWSSIGRVLKLYWCNTGAVLEQWCNSIGAILEQYRKSSETVLEQYWSSTGAILEQYWNSLGTALK